MRETTAEAMTSRSSRRLMGRGDASRWVLSDVGCGWSHDGSRVDLAGVERCAADAKGDPIVLAADDLEFEPGWLDAALETLAQFEDGWGLVGFNDGHWGPELSTHYLMSRRFIVEFSVVSWLGIATGTASTTGKRTRER